MENTQHFNFERPDQGAYFGRWDIPVNSNMTNLDSAMWSLLTNNKDKTRQQISSMGTGGTAEAGIIWYDAAGKNLNLFNGTGLTQILTTSDMIISKPQQSELISGNATSLHQHSGSSDRAFMVRDPSAIPDSGDADSAKKQYAAIPFSLFTSNNVSQNAINAGLRTDVNSIMSRFAGISPDNVNITPGAITATGDITTTKGLQATFGNTNATIKIGGGTTSNYEIVISDNAKPLNFKTPSGAGALNLQANGYTVWTAANMGSGSGLNADSVDNCGVNDSMTTTSNLWTAAKISQVVSGAAGGVPDLVNNANHLGNANMGYFPLDNFVYVDVTQQQPVQNLILLLKAIYPVGSIYMSTSTANPAQIFAFTDWVWEALEPGRVLLSAGTSTSGTTFTLGAKDGAEKHLLVESEIPLHHHANKAGAWDSDWGQQPPAPTEGAGYNVGSNDFRTKIATPVTLADGTASTGGGQSHNNMQPYLVVNMWVRKS